MKEKNEKLFTDKGSADYIAYIGGGSEGSQSYYYTVGYLEAANAIVENIHNPLSINQGSKYMMQEALNGAVFPVCFLYRQYLELELKGLYFSYSTDTDAEKKLFLNDISHNLSDVWKKGKPIVERAIKNVKDFYVKNPDLLEEQDEKIREGMASVGLSTKVNLERYDIGLKKIEDIVKEFNNFDKDSFKFRYPFNKKRDLYHLNEKRINLMNIKEKMNEVAAFFVDILSELDFEMVLKNKK